MQGFSDNLYAWFRDENGNARTRRNATGSPPINSNGSVSVFFCDSMYSCNSKYVAGESTVRTVTYTDWKTRNGPVDKTVTQLVTPKVVVCDRYTIMHGSKWYAPWENRGLSCL